MQKAPHATKHSYIEPLSRINNANLHSFFYSSPGDGYRSFWKTGLGFQVCEVGWPIVGQSKCEEWSFGETTWVKPDNVKIYSLKLWRSHNKVKIECEDCPLKTHTLLGYGIICHLLLFSRSRNIRHLQINGERCSFKFNVSDGIGYASL